MTGEGQFLPANYAIITRIENTKSNGMPRQNTHPVSTSVVKFAILFLEIREALIGISVEKQNLQAWAGATNLSLMFDPESPDFSLSFPKLVV